MLRSMIGLLLLLALPALAAEPPPGAWEFGTDRPGGDYADFNLKRDDPGLCQARCLADAQCLAWTYVAPGVQGDLAHCWLKSSVPDPVPRDCCVSGIEHGPVSAEQLACEAGGGTWARGGRMQEALCFQNFPDAGRPCTRQADCQGQCLDPMETGRPPGECSPVSPLFGCYAYYDADGLHHSICVD